MKFLIVAAALMVAAVSAKSVKITGLRDCGGAGAPVSFSGSILTDPVPVPGDMLMDLTTVTTIAATQSDGLLVRKTTTRTTDNYQVPCLNGISGTCTVELCQAFVDYPEYVCPLLPPGVPCSCPLAADTYHNPDVKVVFNGEWLALDGGVDGDYTTRTELVTPGPAGLVLGCIDIDYTLTAA